MQPVNRSTARNHNTSDNVLGKKVNEVKKGMKLLIQDRLVQHMQTDETKHPEVKLIMPTAAPTPTRPLATHLQKLSVTNAELERIQAGLRWIEGKKQRNYNDLLLRDNIKGLEECALTLKTALDTAQSHILRLQQGEREQMLEVDLANREANLEKKEEVRRQLIAVRREYGLNNKLCLG